MSTHSSGRYFSASNRRRVLCYAGFCASAIFAVLWCVHLYTKYRYMWTERVPADRFVNTREKIICPAFSRGGVYQNPNNIGGRGGPGPYPTSGRSSSSTRTEVVPRVLHQLWKENTLDNAPEHWQDAHKSWRQVLEPHGFTFRLWSDAEGRRLIADKYPWFLPTYDGYPHAIQRVDALRLFVLYEHGGMYADLDIGLHVFSEETSSDDNHLDHLDRDYTAHILACLLRYPVLVPETQPLGVSNDFMVAVAGHPFLGHLLHNLRARSWNLGLPYLTIMLSTGPLFVGLEMADAPHMEDVYILGSEVYGSQRAPYGVFKHVRGNSWHAWDAALIIEAWNVLRSRWLLPLVSVLLLAIIVVATTTTTTTRTKTLRRWYRLLACCHYCHLDSPP